ncbi:MAG: LysE family translocator [Paracoccaceae bacterium]
MFDYTLVHWTSFITAAVLLNLAPGPDIAFILGRTISGGTKAGFAAMFGIWSGAFVHVLMASIGLSALLATSAVAFSVVKWAGAAYLIWLGIQTFRAGGGGFVGDTAKNTESFRAIFQQGVLVAVLNPKVAIFFLAFYRNLSCPAPGRCQRNCSCMAALSLWWRPLSNHPWCWPGNA